MPLIVNTVEMQEVVVNTISMDEVYVNGVLVFSSSQAMTVGSIGTAYGWREGSMGAMNPRIFETPIGNFDCPRYDSSALGGSGVIILTGSWAASTQGAIATHIETDQGSDAFLTFGFRRSASNTDWWITDDPAWNVHLSNRVDDRLKVLIDMQIVHTLTPAQTATIVRGFNIAQSPTGEFQPRLVGTMPPGAECTACSAADTINNFLVTVDGPLIAEGSTIGVIVQGYNGDAEFIMPKVVGLNNFQIVGGVVAGMYDYFGTVLGQPIEVRIRFIP